MHASALAAVLLACALSPLVQAQEPLRMPAAPEPGAPGTATPQPYGQPSTSPIQRQGPGSAPLLPPPQGQRMPGMAPQPPKDQPIPQLERQLQRNRQPAEPDKSQN